MPDPTTDELIAGLDELAAQADDAAESWPRMRSLHLSRASLLRASAARLREMGKPLPQPVDSVDIRYARHRAFLRVTRPWKDRGHDLWYLEPEYANVMMDAILFQTDARAAAPSSQPAPSEESTPTTRAVAEVQYVRDHTERA